MAARKPKKTAPVESTITVEQRIREAVAAARRDGWTIDLEVPWVIRSRRACSPLGALVRDHKVADSPLETAFVLAEILGIAATAVDDIAAGIVGRVPRLSGMRPLHERENQIGLAIRAWVLGGG